MATISTEKLNLKNGTKFKKVVRYAGGKFRITLPEDVCKDLVLPKEKHELIADSEDEVNALFKAKIKEWEQAETSEKKVIFFRAKFQGGLLNEETAKKRHNGVYEPEYKKGGYHQDKTTHAFIASDISWSECNALGLMIEWGVYIKKSFKENSDYRFISGRPFDRIGYRKDNSITEIDWTEEREHFFLQLDESFARMIAKVYSALGDLTPEKLMTLTQSGINLLK